MRSYLHGVVVGPHWSIPTTEVVKRMSELSPAYPLRQYPDICHPRGAQYAIARWHWAWHGPFLPTDISFFLTTFPFI